MTEAEHQNLSVREKLLLAAKEILIEEGHSNATVQKIAARAGVNHGLVHHYFTSKEHMFIEVMRSNPVLGGDEIPPDASEDEIIDYLMAKLFANAQLHVQFHIMAAQMPELREALGRLLDQKRKDIKKRFGITDEEHVTVLIAAVTGLVMHYNLDPSIAVKESLRFLYKLSLSG